jgi:hypothetical protein
MSGYQERFTKGFAQKRAREIRTHYLSAGKTAHIMYLDKEWLRLNAAETTRETFRIHDAGNVDRYVAVVGFKPTEHAIYRGTHYRCIILLALKNGLWLWLDDKTGE